MGERMLTGWMGTFTTTLTFPHVLEGWIVEAVWTQGVSLKGRAYYSYNSMYTLTLPDVLLF